MGLNYTLSDFYAESIDRIDWAKEIL